MIKNASKTANLVAACFFLMACGSDTDGTGDDMNPAGSGGSSGGNTAATNGSNGNATTGSTTGAATSGTTGSTAGTTSGSGTTGSGGNTTGTSTTGGAAGGDDGGVDPGSSSGGGSGDDPATPGNDSATSVQCGADVADCSLTSKSCCAVGLMYPPKFSCNDGTTCAQGQRAVCDGPEDCGGKVCCVAIPSGSVSCIDSCFGSELCHTDEDCSEPGARCERGATFNYWGICG